MDLLQSEKENPEKLKNLTEEEIQQLAAERSAAKTYFGKMKRLIDNLINIGYDVAFNTPVFKPTTETTTEARFFEGLNGKNGRLAAKWVHDNLSKETSQLLREIIRRYEIARDEVSQKDFIKMMQDAVEGIREGRQDRDPTVMQIGRAHV